MRNGAAIKSRPRDSTKTLQNCYKMFDSSLEGGENLTAKTISYASWITAVTAILAAISFIMLALSLHHSTRSALGAHGGGGKASLGFHDGDG